MSRQKRFEPPLNQQLLGNATREFDLGDDEQYVGVQLEELTRLLDESGRAKAAHGALGGEFGYGADFQNSVFEMHPYYWGDCTCGAVDEETDETMDEEYHDPACPVVRPNFKCGNLEIRWYKYIGRGMSANRRVAREELRKIFQRCRRSLKNR